MELILYKNFSKKINSTKRPSGGTVVNVKLKQNTSIESPIFLIDGIDLDVNYCKWADHYYYINDIVMGNNNIYELHCSQDALATHKDAITGFTGYVEYCDTFYNKYIPDTRLSMTEKVDTTVSIAPSPLWTDTHGTVILTVAATDTAAQVGMASQYAVSDANITTFTDWMYNTSLPQSFLNFYNGDPSKALISAHWIPWTVPTTGTKIKLGTHSSDIDAYGLKPYMTRAFDSVTVPIPWKYEDWRDFNPYSIMEIYLPYYGPVVLDQSKFEGETNMKVSYSYDAISGEVVYNLTAGEWYGIYKCSTAVPLAIGQQTGNSVSGLATVLGGTAALAGAAVATVVSGGTTLPIAAAAVGGIASVAKGATTAFMTEASGSGGNGSFASGNAVLQSAADSFLRKIKITLFSHRFSVNEDITTLKEIEGRPWFTKMSLSTLSGFVKCSAASVSVDGLGNDKEIINQWLNQGIYIE